MLSLFYHVTKSLRSPQVSLHRFPMTHIPWSIHVFRHVCSKIVFTFLYFVPFFLPFNFILFNFIFLLLFFFILSAGKVGGKGGSRSKYKKDKPDKKKKEETNATTTKPGSYNESTYFLCNQVTYGAIVWSNKLNRNMS